MTNQTKTSGSRISLPSRLWVPPAGRVVEHRVATAILDGQVCFVVQQLPATSRLNHGKLGARLSNKWGIYQALMVVDGLGKISWWSVGWSLDAWTVGWKR